MSLAASAPRANRPAADRCCHTRIAQVRKLTVRTARA